MHTFITSDTNHVHHNQHPTIADPAGLGDINDQLHGHNFTIDELNEYLLLPKFPADSGEDGKEKSRDLLGCVSTENLENVIMKLVVEVQRGRRSQERYVIFQQQIQEEREQYKVMLEEMKERHKGDIHFLKKEFHC